MWSPRMGSLFRPRPSVRRLAAWGALALGWLLPSTGCQVEYAGMTLPSGKYMHDDVQYFAPGPDFPWANTQAAAQRARMQAMGINMAPPNETGPVVPTPPVGVAPPQGMPGREQDVNQGPMGANPTPPPPMPGMAPVPGGPGGFIPPAPGSAVPPPAPAPAPGGPVPPPGY